MRYFGVLIIILMVFGLTGCYYLAVSNSPYTIQLNTTEDIVVVLNGTIVDHEGFYPRQGVNRMVIIKDNKTIWTGQWDYNDGNIEEFIEFIECDENIIINTKGSRTVGIELMMDDLIEG